MSTEKYKILEKFSVLSSTIVDQEMLEKYIDFCLEKRLEAKITKQTTSHHILPVAKTLPFKEWSDLSLHIWNKAELLYSDHYYAHYLLMKAIDHVATYHAFAAMHKRDFAMGRINKSDLIPENDFDEIWRKRNEKISQLRLEKITVDGTEITKAAFYERNKILSEETLLSMSQRVSGDKNPAKNPDVVSKIRSTKSSTFIDGKNLDTISAERAAETMKKEFVNESGELTTVYEETGKKISTYLLEIEDNGKTKAFNKNKAVHEKLRQKGKWYKVMNIFDETYQEILPAVEVRSKSPGLEGCSKENYLGKTKFGETILKKKGKPELIGLYVERIR
jgi:hypothetical protein